MAMTSNINIEQCLYGYSEGHRLLCYSTNIHNSAQIELLTKSDNISGLPNIPDTGYYSGFPIISIKKYALMKTWPAKEMARPGCVWTHVILINFSDFDKIDDLSNLDLLFQRPTPDLLINKNYNRSIAFNPQNNNLKYNTIPKIKLSETIELFDIIYSNNNEPKIYYSNEPSIHINSLYFIWSLQWPKLRRSFSFTTVGKIFSNNSSSLINNDIVFFINKKDNSKFTLKKDWHFKLLNSLEHHHTKLKEFLWSFGKYFKNGRSKFIYLIELFSIQREIDFSNDYSNAIIYVKNNFADEIERLFLVKNMLDLDTEQDIERKATSYLQSLLKLLPKQFDILAETFENLYKDLKFINNLDKSHLSYFLTHYMASSNNRISLILINHLDSSSILNLYDKKVETLSIIINFRRDILESTLLFSEKTDLLIAFINQNFEKLKYEVNKKTITLTLMHNNEPFKEFFLNIRNHDFLYEVYSSEKYFNLIFNSSLHNKFIQSSIETLNDVNISDGFVCIVVHRLLEASHYKYELCAKISPKNAIVSLTGDLSRLTHDQKFNFCSFLYSKVILLENNEYLYVLAFSFLELHHLMQQGVNTVPGWKLLIDLLPPPIYGKEWDDCMRLRLSIINYCRENSFLARNLLGLIKQDKIITKKLINDLHIYYDTDTNFNFPL